MAISDPYIDIVGASSPQFFDAQGSFVEDIPVVGSASDTITAVASFSSAIDIVGLSDIVEVA